jgi:16S rRNA processing protein RimM
LTAHGVKGELKCLVVTDFPDQRFKRGNRLLLGSEPRVVRSARRQGDLVYLRLDGIDDRTAAEALRGQELVVPRTEAVPLPEGQFYWDQVLGLRVEDTAGQLLGTVADILETGANDVYVVRGGPRGEVLIPAIKDVVRAIDPAAGRMVVDPLPGLLR